MKKDVYLPIAPLVLAIFLFACTAGCIVGCFLVSCYFLIPAVITLAVGLAAFLSWRNQWIVIENNDEFTYSTMFGTKHRYKFSDIREIKQNTDSQTLILKNGKVHIETMAIVSDRFYEMISEHLNETQR